MESLKSARPQENNPSEIIVTPPSMSAELQMCCHSDDLNDLLHIDNLGL